MHYAPLMQISGCTQYTLPSLPYKQAWLTRTVIFLFIYFFYFSSRHLCHGLPKVPLRLITASWKCGSREIYNVCWLSGLAFAVPSDSTSRSAYTHTCHPCRGIPATLQVHDTFILFIYLFFFKPYPRLNGLMEKKREAREVKRRGENRCIDLFYMDFWWRYKIYFGVTDIRLFFGNNHENKIIF